MIPTPEVTTLYDHARDLINFIAADPDSGPREAAVLAEVSKAVEEYDKATTAFVGAISGLQKMKGRPY